MFDFLDSDWFNITIQIVFVLLIYYDVKKYLDTHKKQYIVNIIMTVGFAIWALYPYYTSYVGWDDMQKRAMISNCAGKNTKLCRCLDDLTFKSFTYDNYLSLAQDSAEYKDFLKDAKEDCLDDSWF